MELKRMQYAVLRTYQRWRKNPPTYGSLIPGVLKPLWHAAAYCAAGALACHLVGMTSVGFLFLGLWIGLFLNECARIRSIPVAWSVLSHVLDWSRVERAIAERRLE
jgi:hypothetical protein